MMKLRNKKDVNTFSLLIVFLVLTISGCLPNNEANVTTIASEEHQELFQRELGRENKCINFYYDYERAISERKDQEEEKEEMKEEKTVEPKIEQKKTVVPDYTAATTDPKQVLADKTSELFIKFADELNEFFDLSYYDSSMFDRYVNFKINNSDLKFTTVITRVNIGLDNPFYTHIKNISNDGSTGVLVNKYNKLSSSFVPSNLEKISSAYSNGDRYLRSDVKVLFEKMCLDAEELGLNIFAVSAYRSYSSQKSIYDKYVARNGQKKADTYSARPGHSEHQTGLAVDVIAASSSAKVDKTNEHAWYKDNAHNYGFIIRYQSGKSHITGYIYEPWHLRYLGVELATAVYNSGLTYDEYYARTRTR